MRTRTVCDIVCRYIDPRSVVMKTNVHRDGQIYYFFYRETHKQETFSLHSINPKMLSRALILPKMMDDGSTSRAHNKKLKANLRKAKANERTPLFS